MLENVEGAHRVTVGHGLEYEYFWYLALKGKVVVSLCSCEGHFGSSLELSHFLGKSSDPSLYLS